MIIYTTSKSHQDLVGIQDLQKRNLPQSLTASEIQTQGFVTVEHKLEDLEKLNKNEGHLIIKDKERLIGYLLAMTKKSKNEITILVPMFELFDKICYKEKLISEYNYLVVGQVCIDKDYRGIGLLDKSYEAYRNLFQEKYDFAITEISVNNIRSLKAHERVGFTELSRYTDRNAIAWSLVVWDWK